MSSHRAARPSRPKNKLSLSTLFYYGFGAVAFGIKDNGFAFFLLLYYNQVLGLSSKLASLAIFIALLVDAISDPIVGTISDRLHSRWGRRHPFMYAAALPVSLSYYFLWNPPELDQTGLFVYLLATAIFVRTMITFYEVPSTALAPELSPDYDERTKLAAVRHFFGWAGGIGIAVTTYLVLLVPTDDYPTGQLNPEGYQAYGILGGVIIFIAILVSATGTHRHIPNLKEPPPKRRMSLTATLGEARETLWNRSFIALFGFGIFAAMAGGLAAAMNIYLNTYFWELTAGQIGLLVPSGFVSALIALVMAPIISARIGKKRAAIGLSLLAALIGPVPILARFGGYMPPNGTTELLLCLIAFNVLEITLIIASTTLVSAMMADVVEESELVTGRRSEGIFFAARSFIAKSLAGLGVIMGTLILSWVAFPQDAQPGEVAPDVIHQLGMVYAPTVVGLYLAALMCLLGYNISREQHADNLERLIQIHAEQSGDA
jgi:Na+/melibiose symporter-like transporter